MAESSGSRWIGYVARDRNGQPAVEGNEHLSTEQRADLERRASELARVRGRLQAVVVVDVYENGEAVPHVKFPQGSTADLMRANEVVAKASEVLKNWH